MPREPKPKETIEAESSAQRAAPVQAQGELTEAIAITEAIISAHRQRTGSIDGQAIYTEVAGIFETQTAERTTEAVAELTDRFHYFISGGRRALETELGYIGKNEQLTDEIKRWRCDELRRQYAEAKVMEKMAIVQVTDVLLHKFLNPYERFDDLVQLTRSTQSETGHWSSEFDPNEVVPGTKPLISNQSLQEMRAGIQLALMMRQGVVKLTQQHRGYDGRPNAKAIIAQVFGIHITGRARVVAEGPLSISIVVTDEADYYTIYGKDDPARRSGGFHNHYLKTWLAEPRTFGNQYTALPADQRGLINLINGYERSDTIDHENEHSLYEILIKNRGKKTDVMERLVDKAKKTPGQSLDKSIEGAVTELLFESNNRFIADFANEVMAYVLNNESPSTPTDYIVNSVFRRLTESKLYSHHHLTTEVVETLKKDLLDRSQVLRQAAPIDELTGTILQAYDVKVERTVTKENIARELKHIIAAVADLAKKYPHKKNYIRAILAGTNPLQWSEIGDNIMKGSWKHGAEPRGAENIRDQEKWRLRKQLDTASILIRTLEDDSAVDVESEGLLGDVLYQLKPGEQLETTLHLGERTLFWIKNKSQRQLIDSSGQKIFVYDSSYSGTPTPLIVNGKIVCRVEQEVEKPHGRYTARTKIMILKEGVRKPIGLEYGEIGEVEQWQGKIIFPAKLANGFWCIVDEDGNVLSEQFDNTPSITYGQDHYYVKGRQENKYVIVNDVGQRIGPQNLKNRDTNICVNTSDSQVYLINDHKLYTEGGEEITLSVEKYAHIELISSAHGLIVYAKQPTPQPDKLIFLQSGKEITGARIIANDYNGKTFFKVRVKSDDSKNDYFVDDQGNTIGASLPQPLYDVELSSENQYICISGEKNHRSFHRSDGTQLVESGNNTCIYGSDGKVTAFDQTDDAGQTTIIDLYGQRLFSVSGFARFYPYSDGGKQYFVGVTPDKKVHLMDSTGQRIIEACDEIMTVTNGQVFFRQDDQLKTLQLNP